MKTSSICRLAVISLLAPVIHVSALTVTQSATFSAAASGPGSGPHTAGGGWTYTAFDAALGTLESVSLQVTLTGTATVTEFNIFAVPPIPPQTVQYTPFVFATLNGWLSDGLSTAPAAQFLFTGSTVTLAPFAGHTATLNMSGTVSASTSAPSVLAAFLAAGSHSATAGATFMSSSGYGNLSTTGTITETLTYHYSIPGVPEGGGAAMLLAAAMLVLLVVHRRDQVRGIV